MDPDGYLQQLRNQHKAVRAEAGLLDVQMPDGPVVVETTQHGMRTVPALTDSDITAAVLAAKAVVELDTRCWRLRQDVARLNGQIAELNANTRRARTERQRLRERLMAVETLHGETEQVTCADGCCHEGTGKCRHCGEVYPCETVRVARGTERVNNDGASPDGTGG